jgi:tetratricopeptide (TPR) repeat protein
LPEHTSRHAGKRKGKQAANREKKKGLSREHASILGVAILVIGVFLYNDLTRNSGSPKIQAASSSPANSPVDQKAIDELQEVVDANPGDGPGLLRLANKLQDQSTHDPKLLYRAVDAYRRYLAINPSGQDPRVDLGICYFEISRNDPADGNNYLHMALQEMESVYKANPHHQAAAFNLGIVQLNAGNLDEASEWLRRAASIDPNSDLGRRAKKLLDEHTFGAS